MSSDAIPQPDEINKWPAIVRKTKITNINFAWSEDVYVNITYINIPYPNNPYSNYDKEKLHFDRGSLSHLFTSLKIMWM